MSGVEPEEAAAFRSQCAGLQREQRSENLEQVARVALSKYPADEQLRTFLAHSLLTQGRYREGFRENELRLPKVKSPVTQSRRPEWDGPVAGRSILVWGEQGVGDEIQFARFIPMLRELGASKIILACRPECVRAFNGLGADDVIGRYGRVDLPPYDCWVSAWSIPYRLGLTPQDISGRPYLSAEPHGAGGIGLVEGGNPKHPLDRFRSMPAGLLQAAIPEGQVLAPEGDVYDSLRRLAGLDLLITVDTSWAHMAGALGVPCWVLLSRQGLDWRWMRERSDSPWYDSIRLFRQSTPADWQGVIQQVVEALDVRRRDLRNSIEAK